MDGISKVQAKTVQYTLFVVDNFTGVPWREGVKEQWGNRKHRFSGLSHATSLER